MKFLRYLVDSLVLCLAAGTMLCGVAYVFWVALSGFLD